VKKDFTLIFCLGALLSIVLCSLGKPAFLLSILIIPFFTKQQTIQILCFLVLGGLIGFISVSIDQNKIQREFVPEWVELTGYVQIQEVRSNYQQRLTIEVLDADTLKKGQKVLVSISRYPNIVKGQIVTIRCRLEYPEPFEGFAYDKYLASKSIYFLCRDSKLLTSFETTFYWHRILEYPRIKIAKQIESLWPRPQSSLVLGLLLGTRESFPQITLTEFQRAGVTHIIALSGFNISILIVFLESIAIRLLIPKYIRLPVIIGGIIFFTVFVGAGASIVRAAIMGSLVLIGKYSARITSPLRLMLLTATAMSLLNPFILLYDLGFQLSFLSTFGLLYLTSFFERLFFWIPSLFSLRESLATTMAATATTLPLILLQFEQLSLVSPLANMLILPLIPWLMALCAVTVLLSWVLPFIIFPFRWFVDLGCQYILSMSKFMASFSWSSISFSLTFLAMVITYGFIFLLIFYERKKQDR